MHITKRNYIRDSGYHGTDPSWRNSKILHEAPNIGRRATLGSVADCVFGARAHEESPMTKGRLPREGHNNNNPELAQVSTRLFVRSSQELAIIVLVCSHLMEYDL